MTKKEERKQQMRGGKDRVYVNMYCQLALKCESTSLAS